MERKRKLPARAAARVEQSAKRRQSTPREKSETPAPSPQADEPPPPTPLPTQVQAGKLLPTIEDAQPDNLSVKCFQSISESGVLAESLTRSRQKWISDGYFEKYWTKPHKRKGVVNEDPKNPPKDTMSKVGAVTITIEPHVIEATMYIVKDKSKPLVPSQQNQATPLARPIIQYGPPNGIMPPQPPPAAAQMPALCTPDHMSSDHKIEVCQAQLADQQAISPPAAATTQDSPGVKVVAPPSQSALNMPRQFAASEPAPSPTSETAGHPSTSSFPGQAKPPNSVPGSVAPAAKPTTNDPVIALLAQRASTDPELRDLMKRVAVGQAKGGELAHFQKIIDQLNAEYKKGGGQQRPSADRLLVDGRTVKYFADEVRTIIDIVLTSNPNQKSTDLRPPPRSDPLVVLLVKAALEDMRTKNMIKRIAEGRPSFTDATDLKDILDKLYQDTKTSPTSIPSKTTQPDANTSASGQSKLIVSPSVTHPNAQALRSKGPPPAPKPDISAIVFDFGTGDRYLFPKFSILEYLPASSGQQLVASFLIVRKGSNCEYGGNPDLDYYEPITIRIYTPVGRHLENFARVVAPQDEVRRYMDDVMDNMTRAEYVLLAMRLPRTPKEGETDGTVTVANHEPKTGTSTPVPNGTTDYSFAPPPVMWTHQHSAPKSSDMSTSYMTRGSEQESQARYQRLISSIGVKDVEAI